jgi:phosphate uptake regulator
MNAGDMPLHASLNRMYLQVTSLVRDIVSVIGGEDREFLIDSEERENEVDALLYLIERQVRILLESHIVASSLNLSRTQALEYANLARSLERMMDHAFSLATLVQETSDVKSKMISNQPFESLSIWQQSLKELMINIRTRDSFRIEEARLNLKKVQKLLILHEEDLLSNHFKNKGTVFDFAISESVRRLCAYARDFGEILLNMKIYSELTRSN